MHNVSWILFLLLLRIQGYIFWYVQVTTAPLEYPVCKFSFNVTINNFTLYYNKSDLLLGTVTSSTWQNAEKEIQLDFHSVYAFAFTSTRNGTKSAMSKKVERSTIAAPLPVAVTPSTVKALLIPTKNASYYEFIVSKLPTSDPLPSPASVNTTSLRETTSDLHVALVLYDIEKAQVVTIGDNTSFTFRNIVYYNKPLEARTKYRIFQRTYLNSSLSFSYDWMPQIQTKANEVTIFDETEVTVLTAGIAIGLLALIFIVICFCHWHFTHKYSPKPPKKTRMDISKRLHIDPCLPVTDNFFPDHVTQMKFNNYKGFNDEFAHIPNKICAYKEFQELGEAKMKHFQNIPCYDESRVPSDVYLHANYIPGFNSDQDYIISMNVVTVEEVDAFWDMIWTNNVSTIVMIGEVESGSTPYFPQDRITSVNSLFDITLISQLDSADMVVRTLDMRRGGESRRVEHYQYLSWPTVRVTPHTATSFLQFVITIFKQTMDVDNNPILVHGTTSNGCASIFTCVHTQVLRIVEQNDTNIHSNVVQLRSHRHDGVKSLDEFIFIHDCVLEFILTRNFQDIPIQYLPAYIGNVNRNTAPRFSIEFDFLLKNLAHPNLKSLCGSMTCNKPKNTYEHIKPFDYNRVKLKRMHNSDGSDYINASYVDSYACKRAFIAAQTPTIDAMDGFWRMTYEKEAWVLVLFGQEVEQGQLRSERFWPDAGFAIVLGDLCIKLLDVQETPNKEVLIRKIQIFHLQTGENKLVLFFQYLSWPEEEDISTKSMASLLMILEQTESWKSQLDAKHVTLVSSTGSGRTGVLVALKSVLEESQKLGTVNIFRTVNKLRQQRSVMIQSRAEYSLIYACALEVTKNIRRRSILSIDDIGSTIGLGILPKGFETPVKLDSFSSVWLNEGSDTLQSGESVDLRIGSSGSNFLLVPTGKINAAFDGELNDTQL